MSANLADRVGLTATGVTSLAPRDVRSWLDRVRAGQLDEDERRATMVLVFRFWMLAMALKVIGSSWDVAWHFRQLRDDFAMPHNINLLGDGIAIVLILCHWYTRFAVDKLALRLMIGGVALFAISAPIDVINHAINGLDITSWSPTHFGLYIGSGIMIAGALRAWRLHSDGLKQRSLYLGAFWMFFLENVWFPNQHQEYGVEAIAAWDRGAPYANNELLSFAAETLGRGVDREAVIGFALPIPAWVYPFWAVCTGMLVLVMARHSVGRNWTATLIGAVYVGWRCLIWPILLGTGFPTSAIPFLILAGAVAVDLVFLVRLNWITEAVVGSVLVTLAVYIGGFVQSELITAPPISYWSAPVTAAVLLACWLPLAYLRDRRRFVLF